VKPLGIRSARDAEFPHLPPGRSPGNQTLRNRARRGVVAPFVGVVGTGMFAAGVWIAAGGRGARFDREEELYGGLLFAAIGLLCVYGAFVIWEAGRPKRHPRLRGTTLSLAGDSVRRGDDVTVTFTGRRRDDDRLEVGIACDERFDMETRMYTRGVGTVVRQTGEATVHEEWQAVPSGAVEHTVSFRVPTEAPYSYEGTCLSYAWRISARAVRPLRKDARFDRPIWVEP
jgi:hypothetical protein